MKKLSLVSLAVGIIFTIIGIFSLLNDYASEVFFIISNIAFVICIITFIFRKKTIMFLVSGILIYLGFINYFLTRNSFHSYVMIIVAIILVVIACLSIYRENKVKNKVTND